LSFKVAKSAVKASASSNNASIIAEDPVAPNSVDKLDLTELPFDGATGVFVTTDDVLDGVESRDILPCKLSVDGSRYIVAPTKALIITAPAMNIFFLCIDFVLNNIKDSLKKEL